MTDILTRLRELAGRAIKGPYEPSIRMVQPEMGGNHQMDGTMMIGSRRVHFGGWRERDPTNMEASIRFLAALDPTTILTLLDTIAEANARVAVLVEALNAVTPEGWLEDDTMEHMPGIKQARAALADLPTAVRALIEERDALVRERASAGVHDSIVLLHRAEAAESREADAIASNDDLEEKLRDCTAKLGIAWSHADGREADVAERDARAIELVALHIDAAHNASVFKQRAEAAEARVAELEEIADEFAGLCNSLGVPFGTTAGAVKYIESRIAALELTQRTAGTVEKCSLCSAKFAGKSGVLGSIEHCSDDNCPIRALRPSPSVTP